MLRFAHPPKTRLRRRLRRSICSTLLAVLVVGALPTIAAAETYVVQPGDTLSVIARDHGVDTEELAEANAISDVHLIRVGQVLEIPRPEPVLYTVRSGDTLSEIAVAAGVSSAEVIALNGLGDANLIHVGQVLQLPAGAAAEEPDPAARYPNLPERILQDPDRVALIPLFEKWSEHYGVPTDLVMAVAYRESGWQQQVVSSKGAIGIGQILPRTADWLANDVMQVPELDPTRAEDNIRMSARFLAWLIGFMGDESSAVAGYYQGPTSVGRVGYFDDTKAYVENIGQIRSRFQRGE